jgi:hypothetical protein
MAHSLRRASPFTPCVAICHFSLKPVQPTISRCSLLVRCNAAWTDLVPGRSGSQTFSFRQQGYWPSSATRWDASADLYSPSKGAQAKACSLENRRKGNPMRNMQASSQRSAAYECHSIAPLKRSSVSQILTCTVAVALMLTSSASTALAELSQAADQQHKELAENIKFYAKQPDLELHHQTVCDNSPLPAIPPPAQPAPTLEAMSSSKKLRLLNGSVALGSYDELAYGRLSELHNDEEAHRAMFTTDAWEGMNIVRKYGRLVEGKEEEEKACADCLQNRKLVERAWQVVSNEFYDPVNGFSQVRGWLPLQEDMDWLSKNLLSVVSGCQSPI